MRNSGIWKDDHYDGEETRYIYIYIPVNPKVSIWKLHHLNVCLELFIK